MLLLASCSIPPVAAVNGGPDSPGGDLQDMGDPGGNFDGEPPLTCDTSAMAPNGDSVPIAGGTMIALADGMTVAGDDADEDRVLIFKMGASAIDVVALNPHDEPGRLVEDGAGKLHVVLRRAGAVATIDPVTLMVTRRDVVCPAPRGIAYDVSKDQVHVACVDGSLISLPAAGGAPARTVQLDDDLRDVVVINGALYVSRFKSAELLTLAADGTVASRTKPDSFTMPSSAVFTPSVAWRTIATPSGGIAMLHQRATTATVDISTGPPVGQPDMAGQPSTGYGGGPSTPGEPGPSNCTDEGAVVHTAVSVLSGANANTKPGPFTNLTAAVDVAVSPDGSKFAVVSPSAVGPPALTFDAASYTTDPSTSVCNQFALSVFPSGPPMQVLVAVVFLDNTHLVIQTRMPAGFISVALDGSVLPNGAAVASKLRDPGEALFHTAAGANIACASCHPEGGEDGRVWQFNTGARRTMTLRGGLRGTEPFHWNGDENGLVDLMADVFTNRMRGVVPNCDTMTSLSAWLEGLPVVPTTPPADAAAVARGKTVFESQDSGCTDCHNGPHLTNNINADVGTGAFFNVPRLVELATHAPYLHDGRAATLRDRFDPTIGGGDMHGNQSQLTSSQIDDLLAYLSSL
jgi:mono/diheme cytochrome c family protein